MPNPFPGMDPYLEDDKLWPGFQHHLVHALHQLLLPGLMDRYRARISQRHYVSEQALFTSVIREEHTEGFIEVRQRTDGRLVTLLEVMSPANKMSDAGRQAYLQRRLEAKNAKANIVEVDLVLQGTRSSITRGRACRAGTTPCSSRVPPSRTATRSSPRRSRSGCRNSACRWPPTIAIPSSICKRRSPAPTTRATSPNTSTTTATRRRSSPTRTATGCASGSRSSRSGNRPSTPAADRRRGNIARRITPPPVGGGRENAIMNPQDPTPSVNRRDLLSAGALAAGGALLAASSNALAGQPAAGAGVADRGSSIRITAVRGLPAGTKAYVKIETNTRSPAGAKSPAGAARRLRPGRVAVASCSIGENPTRVEHLWQKLYRSHRDMRGGPFMVAHALGHRHGAVGHHRQAAWRAGLSAARRSLPRQDPHVSRRPSRTKLGTGGPHPFSGNPADINTLRPHDRADAASSSGPDGTIMFDAHCAMPPPMLIQFAAAIEPYDVLWIEEPAVPGNIEVFKRLKQHIRVPLATGERDRTIWEVIPYLQNQAHRHPAIGRRPLRRHQPAEEDRRRWPRRTTCRWRRTTPARSWA